MVLTAVYWELHCKNFTVHTWKYVKIVIIINLYLGSTFIQLQVKPYSSHFGTLQCGTETIIWSIDLLIDKKLLHFNTGILLFKDPHKLTKSLQ